MAKLREIDLNQVYETAETDAQIRQINKKLLPTLLLDKQDWVEDMATKNGYPTVTRRGITSAKVDYNLVDDTTDYVLAQVNAHLKKLGIDLEYAKVDLAENYAYVAVKCGETTKGYTRRITA